MSFDSSTQPWTIVVKKAQNQNRQSYLLCPGLFIIEPLEEAVTQNPILKSEEVGWTTHKRNQLADNITNPELLELSSHSSLVRLTKHGAF